MKAKIAVIAGDGIGPEVVAEGVRVLEQIGKRFGHEFNPGPNPVQEFGLPLTEVMGMLQSEGFPVTFFWPNLAEIETA